VSSRRRHAFDRTPLRPDRLRSTAEGSFAFLPHRFLRDGFWASLDQHQLLLYLLAALLRLDLDDFVAARQGLVQKNLLAYQAAGPRYQVLSLPSSTSNPQAKPHLEMNDRTTTQVHHIRDVLHAVLAR
jgi:hypothetical protein